MIPATLLTTLQGAGWQITDAAIVQPPDINGNQRISKPPITLLLHYLLTPYAAAGDRTIQQLMGAVIKLLYDDPVLTGADLTGGLSTTSEAIKVTMSPLTLEDRTRIWGAVNEPYRLSLAYEARVVKIDPAPGPTQALVNTRVIQPPPPVVEDTP